MKTNKSLYDIQTHVVHSDAETRKSTPFAQWFVDQFSWIKPHVQFSRFVPAVKPDTENLYTEDYQVVWSDADYYLHTNQASYVRYGINAMTSAFKTGKVPKFYASFGGKISRVKLKSMSMQYADECFPGDKVTFLVWEDLKQDRTLHFQVVKGGKPIYFMQCDFAELFDGETPG